MRAFTFLIYFDIIKIHNLLIIYKCIAEKIPFEPTPPGEVLKDEVEFRGITQKKLAKEIGMYYTVNTEYAMLIEAALDLDAEPLLIMQASYNLQMTKNKLNQTFLIFI